MPKLYYIFLFYEASVNFIMNSIKFGLYDKIKYGTLNLESILYVLI